MDVMKKLLWTLPAAALVLSGCSFPGTGSGPSAQSSSLLKSSDGGRTFEAKSRIDDRTDISSVEVLSMAFDPQDPKRIFIGTAEDGIFATEDGAERWKKLDYAPGKVYGLTVDAKNPRRLFATGEWQGRGEVYRSDDGGGKWEKVYSEAGDGTAVASLAQSRSNPDTLYVGTSGGAVVKTTDGGATWRNVGLGADGGRGPVVAIAFDAFRDETVYFAVRGQGVFLTEDGGRTVVSLRERMQGTVASNNVFAFATDPGRSGTAYVGTDRGLFRSADFGKTWTEIDVLDGSKRFAIRAVAINPKNPDEIMYGAGAAVYKSTDGGTRWSTARLMGDKVGGVMKYDPVDPSVVYIGLRAP
jgi:photosystem II stability/assembly factor-like uncharacterized protein